MRIVRLSHRLKKIAEVIALTKGMKLATLTSLLKFHDILASFKCLTDKEDHIKRINGKIIAFHFPIQL
jgi:hypothetical protein